VAIPFLSPHANQNRLWRRLDKCTTYTLGYARRCTAYTTRESHTRERGHR
jgi:hypothetical protein